MSNPLCAQPPKPETYRLDLRGAETPDFSPTLRRLIVSVRFRVRTDSKASGIRDAAYVPQVAQKEKRAARLGRATMLDGLADLARRLLVGGRL